MAESDARLQIAHVLFVDIVGYSQRLIDEQRALIEKLTALVRATEQFREAHAAGKLISIPTGDGMALAFLTTPDAPVRCAIELNKADQFDPKIELRMGIHSGPVDQVFDVNQRTNVAGDGINIAQRVMDCGDAGHILLSQRVAADLAQYGRWRSVIHDLGEVEVKHGVRIQVANLYDNDFGNPALPAKIAVRREAELGRERGTARRRRLVIAGVAIVALAAIAAGLFAYRVSRKLSASELLQEAAAAIPTKSVAVLPFENLTADANNAFFVNGVQDEILTRAGKIASLKVIARTSTRQYEPKPANLAAVGKQLGVANVLEGSVQRIGDKVRVNVQLIRAAGNEQLWGETYDRQLTDVFAVESEIASRIASSLNAALTPEEKPRVNAMPTTNPEAYDLYLQGREILFACVYTPELDAKELQLYQRAVALDPNFALGHTALSERASFDALDHGVTPENKATARREAEEALRIDPDLGEAHVAMGSYYYRVERDYEAAMREYRIAERALPNDAELMRNVAMLKRRQGQWHACIQELERAAVLDPRSVLPLESLAEQYLATHNLAAAEATKRRTLPVAKAISDESAFRVLFGLCDIQWLRTGKTDQHHAALRAATPAALQSGGRDAEADIAWLERNPDGMINAYGNETDPDALWYVAGALMRKGDTAGAKKVVEPLIGPAEALVRRSPFEARYHSRLGLWYAIAGRQEEAIRAGRKAVELLPESKDALDGPKLIGNLAYIYAHVGEEELALDLIEHTIKTAPWAMDQERWQTYRAMQVTWEWDTLRSNPRFQKLIQGEAPQVTFQ